MKVIRKCFSCPKDKNFQKLHVLTADKVKDEYLSG